MKPDFRVKLTAQRLSLTITFILIALPFHAFFSTWAGTNLGNLDLARVWKEILIVLMVPPTIWLAWHTPSIRHWLRYSWLVRLVAAYILLNLAFGWWAYYMGRINSQALIYALIINLRFLGFFLICAVVAANDDFLKKYWPRILLIPAYIVIVFGWIQKWFLPYDFLGHFGYGKDSIPAYQTVDNDLSFRRIQSTLRGANPLGAYLVLIIPAFLLVLRRRIYLWLLSIVAASTILFYSYSRSALVGLGLAIASLGWVLMKRPTVKWIITGIISLLVICGLYLGFRSNQMAQNIFLHTSDISSSIVSSNEVRNAALKDSALDVIHEPLGRGPGTAGPASFRNSHPARIAENYYLQIGEEVGIPGLLVFVAIGVLIAKELWLRRTDTLAQVLLASLIGITFINLVSHAWTDDTLSLIWWGLAGVALAPAILLPKGKKANAQS